MEDIGDTEPSAERVSTARRLRDMHCEDNGVCWWCGYRWPCPTEQWVSVVLRRGSALSGR